MSTEHTKSLVLLNTFVHYRIPANELVKDVDKWKSTLTNSIDSQNAKLSEQVCVYVYMCMCVYVNVLCVCVFVCM